MLDVLVVGGGPAGATAAIHLARAGLSVQIIDRAHFPRPKVCGEGLFGRGVEALAELGVLEGLRGQSRVLQSLRLILDDVSAEGRMSSAGYEAIGVRRTVLDATLIEAAANAGVELCPGVTATDLLPAARGYRGVRTDHGDYEARVIVLADGLRSRLRRIAGLDIAGNTRRYGVSAHFGLAEDVEPRVDIRLLQGHEVYVTPVGEREVNVAVLAGERSVRTFAGSRSETYRELVRRSGLLPASAELLDTPLAAGPFPARARRLWRDNLVLAGDAGGFFDGISGEGMTLALVSAGTAASAIAAYLDDGDRDHFAAYARSRRAMERNSTLLARASLLLASHRRLGRYAIRNLGSHPATFEKLLAINAGFVGLNALRPNDVSAFLPGL